MPTWTPQTERADPVVAKKHSSFVYGTVRLVEHPRHPRLRAPAVEEPSGPVRRHLTARTWTPSKSSSMTDKRRAADSRPSRANAVDGRSSLGWGAAGDGYPPRLRR